MKLTRRNYHSRAANNVFMSVSQFKAFTKCPAAALAEIRGRYKRERTPCLIVGSYIDAHFSGEMDKFKKENRIIFKQDGTLKADYAAADKIIARIERERLMRKFVSGKPQIVLEGEISGVKTKIRVDSLHDDKIVDLKIMKDFDTIYDDAKGELPWWEYWGYDIQGAVYQEIVRQNVGRVLPFYLVAATKEKATDIDILQLGPKTLSFAMENFTAHVEEYDAMKRGVIPAPRCEKCEYCRRTKRIRAPRCSDEEW